MAARIVMLGPVRDGKVQAREITPADAGAYIAGGHWRVNLGLLNGELADATVIQRVDGWVALDGETGLRRAEDAAWRAVGIVSPGSRAFELPTPLSLAPCRVS